MVKPKALKALATGAVLAMAASISAAGVIEDAIARAAGDLQADQQPAGSWGEFGFTGEGVAGLVNAYQLTATGGYKTAADAGGDYCLYDEGGYDGNTGTYAYGLYASGAYALTRLSDISVNPASNSWRTAVGDLYEQVRTGTGTQNYVDYYLSDSYAEDSSAAYDLARHTVAAYYVNAMEKGIFRTGLITALGDIDDGDDSPVMALGAAVWGLALTGDMDSTLVDPNAASSTLWDGVSLSDLPGMLAGQQDSDGSFYTKFDPNEGSGFTETTALAALGLIGADDANYASEILSARLALAGGVDTGGDVYWKIGESSYPQYYFAAGETLEALPEPGIVLILALGGLARLRRRRR